MHMGQNEPLPNFHLAVLEKCAHLARVLAQKNPKSDRAVYDVVCCCRLDESEATVRSLREMVTNMQSQCAELQRDKQVEIASDCFPACSLT